MARHTGAKILVTTAHSGFHGAHRNSESAANFFERHTLQVVHLDRCAQQRRNAPQLALNQITQFAAAKFFFGIAPATFFAHRPPLRYPGRLIE